MTKAIKGPTWALLSPSSLPSDSDRSTLLGSIVADFEHPLAEYIPENVSGIIPQKLLGNPTEDTNFKIALTRARGQNVHQRLADILRAGLQKKITDETHLATTRVQTYELKRQDEVFKILKQIFGDEILKMIDKAPSRNNGAVFMVVAIKTCINAQISSQSLKDESMPTGANTPDPAIATSTSGRSPGRERDVEAGAFRHKNENIERIQVAKGARIFAIQYRLIKRESLWLRTATLRRPGFDIGQYFVPKDRAMFGGEGDEDPEKAGDEESIEEFQEEDEEEEEEEEEDDPIQLGDLQHTWNLNPSDENGVVMAAI